ncbi:hypothetical protein [Lacipirellula sp.]|uniref:hypothetical protein n=1 Tax=Lacipirellula sp. TaxID=2691419 RepID=UPI003D151F73
MNMIPFYRRNALWLAVIAAILVAWSIDRDQLSKHCTRAEIGLFHSEAHASVSESELKALTFAQEMNERNRRAAMEITN